MNYRITEKENIVLGNRRAPHTVFLFHERRPNSAPGGPDWFELQGRYVADGFDCTDAQCVSAALATLNDES